MNSQLPGRPGVIGKSLAHYEVLELLGQGGMGEVYLAHDNKLGRDVAIKVLPGELAEDPERLARFRREAKVLASLNHPNIAAIYGLEEFEGTVFLAMELAEGEDLELRIARGAIPLHETMPIASQIAQGLEEAHERGVIHRDLKPANIKVGPDGKVKILDFGLARAYAGDPEQSDMANSPTITAAMTQQGVILGTAAYMSPEQARGKPLDKRTDVWSYGCVVYQMLTGKMVFGGETVSDTVSEILQLEPDWEALPESIPPNIRRVIGRCLQKDPAQRLRDLGEARIEFQEAIGLTTSQMMAAPATLVEGAPKKSGRLGGLALLAAGLVLGLGAGAFFLRTPAQETASTSQRVTKITMAFPAEAPLSTGSFLPPLAFSPDGETLIYAGTNANDGARRLYLRRLDELGATPLPGTEGAEGPFVSPDGDWVGFYADFKLKKISIHGGLPLTICDARDYRGGTWVTTETIVFTPGQSRGLFTVDSSGGKPQPLTTPDRANDEWTHRLPQALPDGDTVIFTSFEFPYDPERASAQAVSVSNRQIMKLFKSGSMIRYAPPGHLVYVQGATLFAVPFDITGLQPTGPPMPVVEDVAVQYNTGAGHFAVSRRGDLIFPSGEMLGDDDQIYWVDRDGTRSELTGRNMVFRYPRLSPDQRTLAARGIGHGENQYWIASTDGGRLRPLLPGENLEWAPDGKAYYVVVQDDDEEAVHRVPIDQTRAREVVFRTDRGTSLGQGVRGLLFNSPSPDQTLLSLTLGSDATNYDAHVVPVDGSSQEPIVGTEANEHSAGFSPDGHYLLYVSDQSGRYEVYVTDLPAGQAQWRVSDDGGREPMWSPTGSEIFYRRGDDMMAARVVIEPTFDVETPRVLFRGSYEGSLGQPGVPNYDVSNDGLRFLMIASPELDVPTTQANLFLNWTSQLKN